jgi:hypothetical protein
MTMLRHTKRSLYKNIFNRKKVVELPRPPYSPGLAPCDFFLISEAQKHVSGRRYQMQIKSRLAISSVRTVYIAKVINTHLKNELKDLNFVYHMVMIILKDLDNYFDTVLIHAFKYSLYRSFNINNAFKCFFTVIYNYLLEEKVSCN